MRSLETPQEKSEKLFDELCEGLTEVMGTIQEANLLLGTVNLLSMIDADNYEQQIQESNQVLTDNAQDASIQNLERLATTWEVLSTKKAEISNLKEDTERLMSVQTDKFKRNYSSLERLKSVGATSSIPDDIKTFFKAVSK